MHRVKLTMSWSLCCSVKGWLAAVVPACPDRLATGALPGPGDADEHPAARTAATANGTAMALTRTEKPDHGH